tara:strand:- start:15021 stop:15188 length:168 start_codon:yes stop_codon:yes gene_type:complete
MSIERNPAYDGPMGVFTGFGEFDDFDIGPQIEETPEFADFEAREEEEPHTEESEG